MMKYIERAYKAFDNTIMKGVNTAVRAYNWTTGKTKTDLANTLLITAPVFDSLSSLNNGISDWGVTISTSLLYSYTNQKANKWIEKDELNAMNSGLMNVRAENLKKISKTWGIIWLGLGATAIATIISFPREEDKQGALGLETSASGYLLAAGCVMRGAADYVMRADYLPPRKNCVKRGLENLVALYETNQAEPVPLPVLQNAKMHYAPAGI